MLQVFDEWPPDPWEQWSVDELDQIVDVQLDILKRVSPPLFAKTLPLFHGRDRPPAPAETGSIDGRVMCGLGQTNWA